MVVAVSGSSAPSRGSAPPMKAQVAALAALSEVGVKACSSSAAAARTMRTNSSSGRAA
jgi:hypothetical protein